ncbi:intracellular coagulation inhibitor 2-like [Centruroides vittatus]|uniref:intracellular coagulation inhibitor 2-like n=1 Tax=Centruroides vittatus TaxID=120091 RepID=UPI00350F232B
MIQLKGLMLVTILSILIFQTNAEDRLKQFGQANNIAAFYTIKTYKKDDNVILSPVGVVTELAMTYKSCGGATHRDMRRNLGLNESGFPDELFDQTFNDFIYTISEKSRKQAFDVSSAIFSQTNYHILPEYRDLLKNYYHINLTDVDFDGHSKQAVDAINDWIKKQEKGKFSSLVKALSDDTRMIYLNTIYNKMSWKKPFEKTKNEAFYIQKFSTVNAQMMSVNDTFSYASFPDRGYEAVELLYEGDDTSMLIILPDDDLKFSALEKDMNETEINDIVSNLGPANLCVKLPKFSYESVEAFGSSNTYKKYANFSGIHGEMDLLIAEFPYKAAISVNEKETEVNAITALGLELKPGFKEYGVPFFNANQPFLFVIRDRKTNAIIFMGRVSKV